jgi:hypothetical protein
MKENDEWYTPPEIIHSLGEFDLDPASSDEAYKLNQSAKKIYTAKENGLIQDWNGRVWLNPPYSNPLVQQFLLKMAEHNRGIALLFSKVGTKWFHDIVLSNASAIKLLYERIQFLRPDGSKGTQPRNGSILVAYGKQDAEILSKNLMKGKFFHI